MLWASDLFRLIPVTTSLLDIQMEVRPWRQGWGVCPRPVTLVSWRCRGGDGGKLRNAFSKILTMVFPIFLRTCFSFVTTTHHESLSLHSKTRRFPAFTSLKKTSMSDSEKETILSLVKPMFFLGVSPICPYRSSSIFDWTKLRKWAFPGWFLADFPFLQSTSFNRGHSIGGKTMLLEVSFLLLLKNSGPSMYCLIRIHCFRYPTFTVPVQLNGMVSVLMPYPFR
mmetsp:Transcript_41995/g.87602  ORF Transcript_41995/g.87602 Transcript_41995/m.87602 type:complete len:224 (+) Transcript_41995:1074-1745(+)